MRALWQQTAFVWRQMPPADRQRWLDLARIANLRMTGYALFTWFQRTADAPTIRTLERQTGIQVLPPAA